MDKSPCTDVRFPQLKVNICPLLLFPPSCVSSFYNGRRTTNPDSLPWSTLGDTGVTSYCNCRKSLGESTQQNFSVLDERLEVGGTEIDDDLKLMISW